MKEIPLEQAIARKKKHITFTWVYNWLYERFNDDKVSLIYPSELIKPLKLTKQRIWQILDHFRELGFLNKRSDGTSVYFAPIRDSKGELMLKKFIKEIKEELKKKGRL